MNTLIKKTRKESNLNFIDDGHSIMVVNLGR